MQYVNKRITSRFNIRINENNLEQTHQVVSFDDQQADWVYTVGSEPDATFQTANTSDDSLEHFFSRPLKVQSYSWGTGTNLFEKFNPWQDYFENPRVINRITNYNLLRCKLHVKFMLNGNGFHYGRAIASYLPLHNFDEFSKDRTFFIEDVVGASQRPHVYLDPTKSQGGELVLPFVWEANALNIPNQDWRDMGQIIIHGMQNLKHANGASDSVTVSVFVWATDVSLSVPTSNEPGALVPQAGKYTPQADEYGSSPVSKPAAAIARAAGALAKVPVIGAYAKATQLAASTVANIAKVFGYSRPAIISDIQSFKPTYVGNMANTNIPDSCTKLTLDAKQELSCDTRTFGLDGTDEMTIKSVATRESYLTQFGWLVSDSPEDLLWTSEVSPVIWEETINTYKEFHMPACCFATLPFKHWRGTMKFRFQVVASAFHKGRLKIVYDPSLPATNEYNTNYTYIIDLAKERDFTVEVGWGQAFSFLQHRDMLRNGGTIFNDTTQISTPPGILANGVLSVYVVNELTVPNSVANNDIAINVFVSAGDDFEVANPTDLYMNELSWFTPQAGEYLPQAGETPDADLTNAESTPMEMQPTTTMGPELTSSDNTLDVFFGDPIVSFRQCLKRYNYLHNLQFGNAVGYTQWTLSNFPMYFGYAPGAEHETSTAQAFNYAKLTMLNYVTPAFVCRRGGIRWKYMYTAYKNSNVLSGFMAVERDPTTSNVYSQTVISQYPVSNTISRRTHPDLATGTSGWSGLHVVPTSENPVLECELPFYSEERFVPAKKANVTATGVRNFFHKLWAYAGNGSITSEYMGVRAYVSVGEDFTLGFFTGCPVAYAQTLPAPDT
jgi:hypothetical protein